MSSSHENKSQNTDDQDINDNLEEIVSEESVINDNDEADVELANSSSDESSLQADFDSLNEKYLRLSAELDNVQKRARQEMDNTRKFAIKGFATELLSVKDSLEIAINIDLSEQNNDVVENMHKGLELTLKQLNQVFEKFEIEEISPEIGDKLDPDSHQAMSMQESDDVEPNGIMAVFQKGYRLSGRLLRPAMVVVAKKPA